MWQLSMFCTRLDSHHTFVVQRQSLSHLGDVENCKNLCELFVALNKLEVNELFCCKLVDNLAAASISGIHLA